MKNTKLLTGMTAVAMSALLLSGCSSDKEKTADSSESTTEQVASSSSATEESAATESKKLAGADLQDGTYRLEEENYKNGYRGVFEITVKDGKIAESNYDNVNEAGDSKKDDEEYNKSMEEKSGVGPATFIPELNEAFVAAQSATGVEAVTGATHSSHSFQNYAQQLIQAAQAGNTETIMVKNGGELQAGTYKLEEKNYSNGYRVVFEVTVKDGKIAESNYDYINEAGDSKKDDADYNKTMEEKSGVGPATFIPELNKALVAAETPGDVEVVTGATHSSHAFVIYAQQLVNAAENGNTETISVDNIVMEK